MSGGETAPNPFGVQADILDMGIKLSTIGLSVPTDIDLSDLRKSLDWWRTYLSVLTPLAEMGHLEQAKTISMQPDGMDLALGPQSDVMLRAAHSRDGD